MENFIFLIKTLNNKIVPALCLDKVDDYLIFAQIRKANNEDIFNTQSRTMMEKVNRGKPEKDQMKIREEYEIDTVYIGQPKGLYSNSVVMVRKLHKVKKHNLTKEIAKVNDEIVFKCRDLIKQINKIAKLHEELHVLKRKILLASMNNEKYTDYELRIDKILKEIGYPVNKRKKKLPYQNLREVPNKGYIKIYLGGR